MVGRGEKREDKGEESREGERRSPRLALVWAPNG